MDYHKDNPSRVAKQNVGFVIDHTEAGGQNTEYTTMHLDTCIQSYLLFNKQAFN